MRPNGAFETVKQDQQRSIAWAFEVMDVQEITIRRVESLDLRFVSRLPPEHFAP